MELTIPTFSENVSAPHHIYQEISSATFDYQRVSMFTDKHPAKIHSESKANPGHPVDEYRGHCAFNGCKKKRDWEAPSMDKVGLHPSRVDINSIEGHRRTYAGETWRPSCVAPAWEHLGWFMLTCRLALPENSVPLKSRKPLVHQCQSSSLSVFNGHNLGYPTSFY